MVQNIGDAIVFHVPGKSKKIKIHIGQKYNNQEIIHDKTFAQFIQN